MFKRLLNKQGSKILQVTLGKGGKTLFIKVGVAFSVSYGRRVSLFALCTYNCIREGLGDAVNLLYA